MAQLHSSISITYIDFDLETTTVTVNGPPVAVDGLNWPTIMAQWDAVEAAIDALVIGTKVSVTRIARGEIYERTRPASKAAQRETKLKVDGHDTVTFQPRHITLGTFDTTHLVTPPAGQALPSYVDLTAGVGLALKDALDDYWGGPPSFDPPYVTDQAIHVGRNT